MTMKTYTDMEKETLQGKTEPRHGGMSTAAVYVRWPVLMFVFFGGVYTLQMS